MFEHQQKQVLREDYMLLSEINLIFRKNYGNGKMPLTAQHTNS